MLERAAVLNAEGLRCKELCEYDAGRACYERALALLESAGNADPAAIATLYHNLGGIEHARGNHVAGERFARRGLAIRQGLAVPDPEGVAADQVGLAALLDGQGRHQEAAALYAAAVTCLERSPRDVAHDLGSALHNLGSRHAECGELDRAEDLLRRAASLKRGALGPGHHDLVGTLCNLAVVRACRGDAAEAAALFADAAAILARALGPAHPRTEECRLNAARLAAAPAGSKPVGRALQAD